ncbi:MAG: hypothetical protein QW478_13960, partial [Candidatus Micrarchaeaceae archaeon]
MIVDFGNLSYSLQNLVTNLIQIQQNYYDLFVNTTPQYVQIDNIDPVTGNLVTLEVPNWAMLIGKTLYILENAGVFIQMVDSISLQQVYDQSTPDPSNSASITLSNNKSLRVYDSNSTTVYFGIDANTGSVTITGPLYINGTAFVVNSAVTDEDHLLLSPQSGSTIPLQINPDTSLSVPAMQVSVTNNGPSVFSISPSGITNLYQLSVNTNATIGGTVTASNATSNNQLITLGQLSSILNSVENTLNANIYNASSNLALELEEIVLNSTLVTGNFTAFNLIVDGNSQLGTSPGQTVRTYYNTLDDGSGNATFYGSVTAGSVIVASLTDLNNETINGTLTAEVINTSSLNVLDNATIGGTITAIDISGTLTTPNQPNVTSLGTLTGLTVDGNSQLGTSSGQTVKTYNNILDNGYGNATFYGSVTAGSVIVANLTDLSNETINGTLTAEVINTTSLNVINNATIGGSSQLGESVGQTVKTYHNTLDDGSG